MRIILMTTFFLLSLSTKAYFLFPMDPYFVFGQSNYQITYDPYNYYENKLLYPTNNPYMSRVYTERFSRTIDNTFVDNRFQRYLDQSMRTDYYCPAVDPVNYNSTQVKKKKKRKVKKPLTTFGKIRLKVTRFFFGKEKKKKETEAPIAESTPIPVEEETPIYQLPNFLYSQGSKCNKFVDSNGYGPYGEELINHIETYGDNSNFYSSDLKAMKLDPELCPKWGQLNKLEKQNFWVWTFAAVAYTETRCIASRNNPNATDGVAIGLFQLNEHARDRKWRGGPGRNACGVRSVQSASANIKCSVEIMHELLKGNDGMYKTKRSRAGRLYGGLSYWEHLNKSNGGKIGQALKRYEPCH